MRILIYLLLFANLLFVVVNYFVLEPQNKRTKLTEVKRSDNYSLVLLSEVKKSDLITEIVEKKIYEDKAESKQLIECLKVVGDWELDGLSGLKEKLRSLNISVIAEGKERRKKVNYWVLIPPFASKQEAITAKRQLQSEKIVDTFIIKSGARSNALSLGLYSKAEGAERRANYVNSKKLGIAKASIEELTLYVDRYWIKLIPVDGDPDLITDLIEDGVLDTKLDQCEIER